MTSTNALPKPTSDRSQLSADLAEYGYCLVADALPGAKLKGLQAAVDRTAGEDIAGGLPFVDEGGANQRLWQLLNRGEEFVELAEHPVALELAGELLGNRTAYGIENDGLPQFLLSSLTANIAGYGGTPMLMHCDQGYVHEPWPDYPIVCNGGWLLDDFREENGATLAIPGSHKLNRNPATGEEKEAIPVEAPAGTLFFFDGRLWHGTGSNRTRTLRRGIFSYFCQPWIRTQENHTASLDPEVAENASPVLRRLVGLDAYGISVGMINGLPPFGPKDADHFAR